VRSRAVASLLCGRLVASVTLPARGEIRVTRARSLWIPRGISLPASRDWVQAFLHNFKKRSLH
jgi:hypothetical protein